MGLRFLDQLARGEATAGALLDSLPRVVNTPEIRIDCADARKFQIVEEVQTRLRARGASFSDVDGVRAETEDGWWLLRASNTQPVLVARCEAGDDAGLARLKAEVRKELAPAGIDTECLA